MLDRKRELVALGSVEVRVLAMALAQLLCERLVGAFLERALLIEDMQDAHQLLVVNQVQAFLVVDEFDGFPLDALPLVLGLLRLEHVPVKLLLQPLVSVVDAQLLKGVHLEVLEPEDVEDAAEGSRFGVVDELVVASIDEPREEFAIDGLG